MYAHVTDGVVDRFGLPDTWRRDDGSTVSGYHFTDPADLAADGAAAQACSVRPTR